MDSFTTYFSYDFGNCYQFNAVFNSSIKKSFSEGIDYGLTLLMGPIVNNNKYLTSTSRGLVVFVQNQSFPLSDHDLINIETGKETNIGIKRVFTQNQPKPYSECVDLSEFSSDLYDFMAK